MPGFGSSRTLGSAWGLSGHANSGDVVLSRHGGDLVKALPMANLPWGFYNYAANVGSSLLPLTSLDGHVVCAAH